ncbi:hypothetical protein L7F22_058936 [Adiantum nelumboides]|nr:hypothetical protein [Adiantum nelumboides]
MFLLWSGRGRLFPPAIIRRFWPRAKSVQCAVIGLMEQYIPMLEFFSGGRLPLVSTKYAASECLFGINMNPVCSLYEVSYTFLSNMAYFEFLPLQAANEDDNDETSIHQSYSYSCPMLSYSVHFVSCTCCLAGLYRYRVGDCPSDGVSQQGPTIPPNRSQECGVEHWHREDG